MLGERYWYEANDAERALLCYDHELALLKTFYVEYDSSYVGPCYKRMGDVYNGNSDINNAISAYQKAINACTLDEEEHYFTLATCWSHIGVMQTWRQIEAFERAFTYLCKASESSLLKNADKIAECYICLAKSYAKSNKYIEGLAYCEQALHLYRF